MKFIDNQDGTITAGNGLIWQKDCQENLTWQRAMDYAENLDLAEHKDWRLPTMEELTTLVNYNKYRPISDFPNISLDTFWSSSSYAGSTFFAWAVNFIAGSVYNFNKSSNNYARCVRGENKPNTFREITKYKHNSPWEFL